MSTSKQFLSNMFYSQSNFKLLNELNRDNENNNVDEETRIENYKKIILLPYNYVTQSTGKNFRTIFFKAMNNWLKISEEDLNLICEIIETLHNASLIHDDIEDNSQIRRGAPAAHQVFGLPLSLNAGTYAMLLALDTIVKRFPTKYVAEASKIFSEHLLSAHIGQGLDIYWRDSFTCPTEEDYLYMIECKTTGLFGFGVRLMQLLSENKTDYLPFVRVVGQYFQIRDDYANLKLDEYEKTKGFAEDLTEGKFSFPVIHAIMNNRNDATLISILRQRPTDITTKKYAIDLLEKFGSISYTFETIQKLDQKCRKLLEEFGDNQEMNKILEILKI